ncbi:TPA: hypothetical protein U3L57_000108 [Streptococcus agalactiae]|nr:hypothetical protein [Streptococcus agalactiae]
MVIPKEQIAHDLAIAVISAKLNKQIHPTHSRQLLVDYEQEFKEFIRLQNL